MRHLRKTCNTKQHGAVIGGWILTNPLLDLHQHPSPGFVYSQKLTFDELGTLLGIDDKKLKEAAWFNRFSTK
jgi:hypothetical protein